jgi:hypothetical protein
MPCARFVHLAEYWIPVPDAIHPYLNLRFDAKHLLYGSAREGVGLTGVPTATPILWLEGAEIDTDDEGQQIQRDFSGRGVGGELLLVLHLS